MIRKVSVQLTKQRQNERESPTFGPYKLGVPVRMVARLSGRVLDLAQSTVLGGTRRDFEVGRTKTGGHGVDCHGYLVSVSSLNSIAVTESYSFRYKPTTDCVSTFRDDTREREWKRSIDAHGFEYHGTQVF